MSRPFAWSSTSAVARRPGHARGLCRAIAAAAVLGSVAFVPGEATACACCSEPGQRIEQDIALGAFYRAELARIRADATVRLYTDACGTDCVSGIVDPQDQWQAEIALRETGFRIDLADGFGSIALDWPPILHWFAVDPGPDPDQEPGATPLPVPALYTEYRMRGVLQATGAFAAADGAIAELVLAGDGNACPLAMPVRRWTLSVNDGRASFRLFGDILPPD